MSVIHHILICFTISLAVLLPETGWSYISIRGQDQGFLSAGRQTSTGGQENAFVLYDELERTPGRRQKVLFRPAGFFIPADFIPGTMPTSVFLYGFSTTEAALEDLIYANLKMSKLMEEYKDVQARSRELLFDFQHLFDPVDKDGRLVSDTAEELKEGLNQTGLDNSLVLNFYSHQDAVNWNSVPRHIFPGSTPLVSGSAGDNSSGGKQAGGNANITPERGRYNSTGGGSDPFIVKIFIKLFNIIPYLMSHKVEAGFYGLILLTFFMFLSSIFKR